MNIGVIENTGSLAPVQGTWQDMLCFPEAYGTACLEARQGDRLLLDAGVCTEGGWRAGQLILSLAFGGNGMVTFDRIQTSQGSVPTVDCYLDRTVDAAEAYKRMEEGNPSLRVVEANGIDAAKKDFEKSDKTILLFSEQSLTGRIVGLGRVLPDLAAWLQDERGLPQESILWGWSSAPLLISSCDRIQEFDRQAQAMKLGALASLWVRSEDDLLVRACEEWSGAGEMRLHNVATGNTFARGSLDEDALGKLFTIGKRE